MNKEMPEESCYVRATCNYHYNHKGKDVTMARDEVFLLIKKTTDDWWQVVRSGEHKAFFAPSKYLEATNVSIDAMKSSLRKKVAHQRHLQNQQRIYEETRKQKNYLEVSLDGSESPPIVYAGDVKPNQVRREKEFHQKEAVEPPKGFADVNKSSIVTSTCNIKNFNDYNVNNAQLNCSLKSTTGFVSDANGNEEMETTLNKSVDPFCGSAKSNSAYERLSICSSPEKRLTGEFEINSTHTSKSSLNDCSRSSIESFSQLKVTGNMMGKAASFDVLQSDDENVSVLNKSYQKAASSEELDHRYRRKELLFQSDRLSLRNRSNSVELKRFDNNLDLSECEKVTSLEKRKCRITRDPMNRRRSWALNEYQSHSTFQKTKGNELDTSMILDMPPKLPPKLRKNLKSFLSSSSDNINNYGNFLTETKDEGLFRLCEEKVLENDSDVGFHRREPNKTFGMPKKVMPPSDESDVDEKGNSLEDSFSRRVPGKLSGWKKVQEALANEKFVSVHKEDIRSLKERRVEELIEKIESQSKISEPVVSSISKPKAPQFQTPPTPTDPPRRIVFDDWGEYIDRETSRPFYFNPKTMEKRWKPPRKSICSTLASEASHASSEKSPSLKSLKVPSPVLPPNTNLLWPNRERSFTSSSGQSNATHIVNHKLHSSISLNPDKASHTLPLNPTPSIIIPIPTKSSYTLPPNPATKEEPSPTPKSSRSFFSAISSSLSFIKHTGSNHNNQTGNSDCPSPSSSHSPPQVPPSSAKPLLGGGSNCSTPGTPSSLESLNEEPEHVTLQLALERFHIPKGWIRKYDALSHQVYFESLVTGEKWNPAIDKCGTIYVYSATGGESKWTLQEYEDLSPSSLHSPSLSPFERDKEEALREDILNWRVTMKDGKKAKKSWSTSYAKYYPNMKKNIYGKSFGSITFAKKLNDTKKVECFDLVPPCFIDFTLKKPNCLCLRNGDLTEILIQADTPTITTEWTKLLIENDKVQEKNLAAEKEKKTSKGGDKAISKKESQDEADATKGIKDSLMLFFKRRIQQETLAKKGIYKDTVFGSTIGDLCQKEKLDTPVFVLQCIKNIEKNKENFKVDGLYRISGNASKIQKIRIEIAQNRYAILEEEKDVHNLTGALKLFFRELKEPLIPFANYSSFIQATDHTKSKSRVDALRQAMKKLPVCNRETLKILLDHLLKVNEYEQENRMSIMNLAIVFGPCLLWPETTSGFDLMTDAMLHNRVVESLLSHFDEIFRKK